MEPKNNWQTWCCFPQPMQGGVFTPPSDKSLSQRAVILAALAEGVSTIQHFLLSEDCLHTLEAVKACGVFVDLEGDTLRVQGKGKAGWSQPKSPLYFGNSGTGLRLMAGVLAAMPFHSILTGDLSLSARPMARILEPLADMGADILSDKNRLPLSIFPALLAPLSYKLPIPSAQVKSCLLLAALVSGQSLILEGAIESRDHTERLLSYLGVHCKKEGTQLHLLPNQSVRSFDWKVPGDFSSAAFFIACIAGMPGRYLRVEEVGLNPGRIGLLWHLQKMGANIRWQMVVTEPEPVGTIEVWGQALSAVSLVMEPDWIDEFPAFCLAAVRAKGVSSVSGLSELRVKESDRVMAMLEGLKALGIRAWVEDDIFYLEGESVIMEGVVDSLGDHRIAMALLLLGTEAKGPILVKGASSVLTSFPHFRTVANKLGCKIDACTSDYH